MQLFFQSSNLLFYNLLFIINENVKTRLIIISNSHEYCNYCGTVFVLKVCEIIDNCRFEFFKGYSVHTYKRFRDLLYISKKSSN